MVSTAPMYLEDIAQLQGYDVNVVPAATLSFDSKLTEAQLEKALVQQLRTEAVSEPHQQPPAAAERSADESSDSETTVKTGHGTVAAAPTPFAVDTQTEAVSSVTGSASQSNTASQASVRSDSALKAAVDAGARPDSALESEVEKRRGEIAEPDAAATASRGEIVEPIVLEAAQSAAAASDGNKAAISGVGAGDGSVEESNWLAEYEQLQQEWVEPEASDAAAAANSGANAPDAAAGGVTADDGADISAAAAEAAAAAAAEAMQSPAAADLLSVLEQRLQKAIEAGDPAGSAKPTPVAESAAAATDATDTLALLEEQVQKAIDAGQSSAADRPASSPSSSSSADPEATPAGTSSANGEGATQLDRDLRLIEHRLSRFVGLVGDPNRKKKKQPAAVGSSGAAATGSTSPGLKVKDLVKPLKQLRDDLESAKRGIEERAAREGVELPKPEPPSGLLRDLQDAQELKRQMREPTPNSSASLRSSAAASLAALDETAEAARSAAAQNARAKPRNMDWLGSKPDQQAAADAQKTAAAAAAKPATDSEAPSTAPGTTAASNAAADGTPPGGGGGASSSDSQPGAESWLAPSDAATSTGRAKPRAWGAWGSNRRIAKSNVTLTKPPSGEAAAAEMEGFLKDNSTPRDVVQPTVVQDAASAADAGPTVTEDGAVIVSMKAGGNRPKKKKRPAEERQFTVKEAMRAVTEDLSTDDGEGDGGKFGVLFAIMHANASFNPVSVRSTLFSDGGSSTANAASDVRCACRSTNTWSHTSAVCPFDIQMFLLFDVRRCQSNYESVMSGDSSSCPSLLNKRSVTKNGNFIDSPY